MTDAGSIAADYTDLPGVPGGKFSQRRSSLNYAYVPDLQGHTRYLTNSAATVVTTNIHDAFGAQILGQGTVNDSYRAFGQWQYYRDAGTSRLYVHDRNLLPVVGQWMSPDQVETEARYGYVGNRPTVEVDPSGMQGAHDSRNWAIIRHAVRRGRLSPNEGKLIGAAILAIQGELPHTLRLPLRANLSDLPIHLSRDGRTGHILARMGTDPLMDLRSVDLFTYLQRIAYVHDESREHRDRRLSAAGAAQRAAVNRNIGEKIGQELLSPIQRDFIPQVPVDMLQDPNLEWTDQSITVKSKKTASAFFETLKLFPGFKRPAVVGQLPVNRVGQYLSFSFHNDSRSYGQRDFDVEIVKLDPKRLVFVAQTLSGHPITGYRYWIVTRKDDQIVVSTGSVDRTTLSIDTFKSRMPNILGPTGRESMFAGWRNMLLAVVRQTDPKYRLVKDELYPPRIIKNPQAWPEYDTLVKLITGP